MIRVKKDFYAIGQGCFYSEKLFFNNEIRTIVYDCGSIQMDKLILEISQSGLSEIDYLVISHFHKDHINGITFLKQRCTIKNVIIPKLEPLDVAFYLGSGNTIEEILISPESFFDGSNIIVVNSGMGESDIKIGSNLANEITHNTCVPIFSYDSNVIWVLKFYIDSLQLNLNALTAKQKQAYDSIISIDNYAEKKRELIDVYKKLSKKDINLTSMSMISAPINHYWHYRHDVVISVMNGDILLDNEAKIVTFTKHYSDFNNFKFDFHIPHHGSHKNLLRPINEWLIESGIVMSGYENQYGHPSGIILRKFSDSRIPVKKLTEFDRKYSKLIVCNL